MSTVVATSGTFYMKRILWLLYLAACAFGILFLTVLEATKN